MKLHTRYFVIEDGPVGTAIYYPKSQYYSEFLDRWIHAKVAGILRALDRENAGVNYIESTISMIEGRSMIYKYEKYLRETKRQLKKDETVLKRLLKGT
jgi:hypothetical protein